MANQPWHRTPRYQLWAPRITRAAALDPRAVCALCGKTAGQHPLGKNGKPQRWHAAHTIPGSTTWQPWLGPDAPPPGDWLAPGMSRCNIAAGNQARQDLHTERWWNDAILPMRRLPRRNH